MMEVMTDNKNRTVPDIRHLMSKNGGNLGESGCVNWMFAKKGTITIQKSGLDEESVIELLIEIGVDDYNVYEDYYEIVTTPEMFSEIGIELEKKGFSIDGEIGLIPVNFVKVPQSGSEKILKLLELLEDHDDIQKIYSNFEIE